ncbi:MAG: transposase [Akkermansia sp.]
MGRLKRRDLKRGIYHVYNKSTNHMWILEEDEMKDRFLNLLKHFALKYPVNIYHYCIMSNHFHLAIEGDIKNISKFVGALCSQYSRYYRDVTDTGRGPIWQSRYHSVFVQKEGYLSRLGRYIELNPVRAKIINRSQLSDYKWCSAKNYLKGIKDVLVKPIAHPFYRTADRYSENHMKRYADYLCVPYEDYEEDIRLFRSNATQIGDANFLTRLVAGISDRVQLLKGRPKKAQS